VERLAKILIALREEVTDANIAAFEDSLKTHNHMELIQRIKVKDGVFGAPHFEFLQMLADFYKSYRYDRFSLSDCQNGDKEKRALIAFIEKNLKIMIEEKDFFATPNDRRIKHFVGKIIQRIVMYLYGEIEKASSANRVYTYEVRTCSKAAKIFLKKEFDFYSEDVLWKEGLVFCLNNVSNKHLELYKSLPPLEFDAGDMPNLVRTLKSDIHRQSYTDWLDTFYEEIEDKKARLDFLDIIGDDTLILGEGDDWPPEASDELFSSLPPDAEMLSESGADSFFHGESK
jgi:hypothetical protein